jgi:predicted nucleotidyltransferase
MNLESLKPRISEIAQKYSLDLVVLFGSQATGRIHEKSDVDLAVIGKRPPNRARLAIEFDQIFQRNDVEVIDLSRASPTLMREIVIEGKLLYEREPDLFFRWKLYAIKIWMETGWLRKLRDKKLVEWARTIK